MVRRDQSLSLIILKIREDYFNAHQICEDCGKTAPQCNTNMLSLRLYKPNMIILSKNKEGLDLKYPAQYLSINKNC